jgi:hypothetical protein
MARLATILILCCVFGLAVGAALDSVAAPVP